MRRMVCGRSSRSGSGWTSAAQTYAPLAALHLCSSHWRLQALHTGCQAYLQACPPL